MKIYTKILFGLFIVLSCGGVAHASETSYEEMRRLNLLYDSLIQEIGTLRAELRLEGGLNLETERAIQSWVDWARSSFRAGNRRLDLYKTIDVLRDNKLALEKLLSVRNGTVDSSGLIVSEEDILPHEDLHNLHITDGLILSGSQPTESGYRYLKKKGVTTVINWRREDDSEKKMVEGLGLKYYYIPITPAHPPSEKQAEEFLLIIEEVRSKGEKLYHHCFHGVGRCFTMNAACLVAKGMPAEEAIEEGVKRARCWPIEQEEQLKEQGISLGEAGLNSFTPQFDFLRNFELLLPRRVLQ